MFAVQSLGFTLFVLGAGWCVDRYGLRKVLLAGAACLGTGVLIFAKAGSIYTASAGLFFLGISGGLIEVCANTLISYLYEKNRGTALNFLHVFFGVGALMGPFFCGRLIASGFSFRIAYLVVFCLSAACLAYMYFYLLPPKRRAQAESFSGPTLRELMRNRTVILMGVVITGYVGAEIGINNWVVHFMEKQRHILKVTASLYLSFFWASMTAGRVLCTLIAKWLKPESLLCILSALSCASFLAFLGVSDSLSSGFALCLVGFFFSGLFASVMAVAGDRFSNAPGTVNGLLMTYLGAGMIVFPAMIGAVMRTYSFTLAMWIPFALLMGMLTASLLLYRLPNQ